MIIKETYMNKKVNSDIKLNIGIIEDYIAKNCLTKTEFIRRCNISSSTFYRIMQGKDFYLIALLRIAKAMDIQIYRFFE